MSTGRLESFSDGVIAVAITLLVLDLKVPDPVSHSTLASALGSEWPNHAAYVVSFTTIGIIWLNHHATILRLREADATVLLANLLVLMTVVVIPFATSLMAKYVNQGHGEHIGAGVYAGSLLAMSAAFSVLNWQTLIRRPHLLRAELGPDRRRAILRRDLAGRVPYAVATALALFSAYATLGICAVVAVFYALPVSRPQ